MNQDLIRNAGAQPASGTGRIESGDVLGFEISLCVRRADGFAARLLGWMGKARAPAGTALWLRPCRAVHTCLMRFPIDLVFLDAGLRVVRVVASLPPWRARWERSAASVLELAAGRADALGIQVGRRLRLSCRMLFLAAGLAIFPSADVLAASPPAELPPIQLVRPLQPDTLERLVQEAESLYLARQWARAMEAFRAITDYEPNHRLAWMRIGNLHHQRDQLGAAASAYRKAASVHAQGTMPPSAQGASADGLRARALANLAAVNLELAKAALAELSALGLPADSAARLLGARIEDDLARLGSAAEAPATPANARPAAAPARTDPPAVRIEYLREAPPPRGRP